MIYIFSLICLNSIYLICAKLYYFFNLYNNSLSFYILRKSLIYSQYLGLAPSNANFIFTIKLYTKLIGFLDESCRLRKFFIK
jgi:hypothetical protein